MSIDTEFFGRSNSGQKTPVLAIRSSKPQSKSRDMMFGAVFPGLFVVLVYYHFFVYSPQTPEFYSKILQKYIGG